MTDSARPLLGPNILLMGPSGTGKTHSLGTLADWCQANGKELFVLFTENGLETLLGYWLDERPGHVPTEVPACLHYHQALTTPLPLTALIDASEKVGKLSYENIAKMIDPMRSANNAFHKLLVSCSDFPDDRTGQKFGPVDKWGIEKVFAIDSLSELANAAMKMVVGNKPAASPSDYGVAQNNLLNFLRLCTQGIPCTFAMTAHVDRQQDEITGAVKLMVKSLGKALGPDIPPLFSDVVYTVRENSEFYWDTAAYGVDVKTRSLGYRSKIKPDFSQIMNIWTSRGGK